MINKVLGDTIVFEAVLTDIDGTAVTNATCLLTLTDGYGSQVLSANATHYSGGTYRRGQSSSSWNFGPVNEQWRFTSSAGTTTQIISNRFRIIGTVPPTTYITAGELFRYYENIEDYFEGEEDAKCIEASAVVDAALESIGIKLPVKLGANGLYDQPIRDWAANEAIYRIVASRQGAYIKNGDEDPWFKAFQENADRIHNKFKKKEYTLARDYSSGESGVGLATKVVGNSAAQMETNWQGFGSGYRGADFQRDWVIEITGTGTYGKINEAVFKWSYDGGLSFFGTDVTYGTSSYEWLHLQDGVCVRFHRGTSTGSAGLFSVGDTWKFTTTPSGQTVGGYKTARSY